MTATREEYERVAQAMNAAAYAWMKARPFAQPCFRFEAFEAEVKRRAGRPAHEKVAVAAPLDAHVIGQIAGNEDARQLLLAMDEASGHQGTYLQAKALVEMQLEAAIARNTGAVDAVGDWRCPCCGEMLDGWTDVGLSGARPACGALTVCAYCFARLRVAEERYVGLTDLQVEALSDHEQRALRDGVELVRKMAADRAREAGRRS